MLSHTDGMPNGFEHWNIRKIVTLGITIRWINLLIPAKRHQGVFFTRSNCFGQADFPRQLACVIYY